MGGRRGGGCTGLTASRATQLGDGYGWGWGVGGSRPGERRVFVWEVGGYGGGWGKQAFTTYDTKLNID